MTKINRNDRLWKAMVDLGFERARFSKSLARVYGGFELGDPVADDMPLRQGQLVATDDINGAVFLLSDYNVAPPVLGRLLFYWRHQLALITFKYSSTCDGEWRRLIDVTSKKYGSPSRENCVSAVWNDGHTVFCLSRKWSADFSTSLGDLVFLLRFFHLCNLRQADHCAERTNDLKSPAFDCVNSAAQDYKF